jgi:NADH:ubiquinone oxidoreductase subunit 2 (subunit N)
MPVFLIIYQNKTILFLFIIRSSVLGSSFILNKKSFKEILALSSIFNLSWILCAITIRLKILLLFSAIYWARLIPFIEDLLKIRNKPILFIKTINLAGIPPLILFLAKWVTLSGMLKSNLILSAALILTIRSVNAFVYLRITRTFLLKPGLKTQRLRYKEIGFLSLNILVLPL